ncbi:amidohydrolase [Penicillium longicatenatum]|nr:amidohydrolase [Penicillium longicatenatum]
MAMWPAEKMNALRKRPGLPDIRSAGLPVTASGSVHSCMLPLPEEASLSGPEQAEPFVQKSIADGSDYIKLISNVPGPS